MDMDGLKTYGGMNNDGIWKSYGWADVLAMIPFDLPTNK